MPPVKVFKHVDYYSLGSMVAVIMFVTLICVKIDCTSNKITFPTTWHRGIISHCRI